MTDDIVATLLRHAELSVTDAAAPTDEIWRRLVSELEPVSWRRQLARRLRSPGGALVTGPRRRFVIVCVMASVTLAAALLANSGSDPRATRVTTDRPDRPTTKRDPTPDGIVGSGSDRPVTGPVDQRVAGGRRRSLRSNSLGQRSSAQESLGLADDRILYVVGNTDTGYFELHVLDLRTGATTTLPGDESRLEPAVSPDGTQIAFSASTGSAPDFPDLAVMNADGTGRRTLVVDGGGYGPRWSPDGKQIVYSSGAQEPGCAGNPVVGGCPALWIVNADGSGAHQIASGESPDWSPDGKRIVFEDIAGDTGGACDEMVLADCRTELFVVRTDGTGRRSLGHDPNMSRWHGRWSPDGTRILFGATSTPGLGGEQLWIENTDGTGAHRLVQSPQEDAWGTWSSDGRRVLFLSNRDTYWELYMCDADGSNQRVIKQDPDVNEQQPVFLPSAHKA
jgi:TolB protein